MTPPTIVASMLILVLCAIAAVSDVRTGRIPNRLVAWGLGLGATLPVLSALLSAPHGALLGVLGEGLGEALAGLIVTAAIPLGLYRMRALGGGDVKLFAAVGSLAGPGLGFAIVSHAFFFAVPLALAIWIKERRLPAALGVTGRLASSWAPRGARRVCRAELTRVKFAPAILLAAVWVLLRALAATSS
jgi:prepilin peptidase CpaA